MSNTVALHDEVLPISIIVPTFSEETMLPALFESIKLQAFQPQEVIIADAQSPDRTREVALSYGAKVVEGGRIAVGRNNGAAAASSEWLLFMDADTVLSSPLTLVEAYVECMKYSADIASAKYSVIPHEKPRFGRFIGHIVWFIRNSMASFQNVTQKVMFEGGAFILVKKSVFEKTGGFREDVALTDDVIFFQDAGKVGAKYRNLNAKVQTSSRRFDTPKKFFTAARYVVIQSVVLAFGVYLGSRVIKKVANMYGPLGGGKGRLPVDGQ